MENDKEQQKFDIFKIFIKTLEHISLSYYKRYNLDKILNAVENLDIDEFIITSYNLMNDGVEDVVDTFVDSWIKNIQEQFEQKITEIKNKLQTEGLPSEKIDEKLKEIPNFGDLRKEDFINYKKFIQEKLIDKLGLKTEEEIENFFKEYVNDVVNKSITDATASLPLTFAQFLASIFPLGTEPLVAVNKVGDMVEGIVENAIRTIVEKTVNKNKDPVGKIGGRRKKRKSKSKHFYINRIKRTLKFFYNY
jgi:hypothetical protein